MADPFRFRCDDLPEQSLRVLAFTMRETLAAPYELTVVLDCRDDALVSDGRLGRQGTLVVAERSIHGFVHESELLLAEGTRRFHRLVLRPALQTLELSCHSRVFVEQSVPAIIEKVLGHAGVDDYELRLSGDYPKRRHVCQYREADLAFLQRWMEREGIYYYFVHHDAGTTLVVTDDTSSHHQLEAGRVRFAGSRVDWNIGEHLRSWRRAHAAAIATAALDDYDYLKPSLALRAEGPTEAIGFESYVRFEDNLQDGAEAKHQQELAAQRERAAQVRFRGHGLVAALHAGATFGLEEHPRDGFNQTYYAVSVVHRGRHLDEDAALLRYLGVEPTTEAHRVEVDALPKDVPFRPQRRAPWPRAHGVEHGLVDGGADGPYAQIDAEGRYRVRMSFDEAGSSAGQASAWLRMLQPHGGSPEGFHFPLRKGTEVLIAFVHGDPDRPFIVGAVPNPKTPSPVTSSNHTKNVLQTGSKNRVELDDADGSQYIDISSPPERTFVHLGAHAGLGDHNIVVSTDGDGLHHAGGNRDLTIGGNQTEKVTGNLTEEYASDQTTHVFAAFDETIDAGKTQTISSGSKQSIDGGLTQTISGGETRTVDGGLTESISADRTQTIVGGTTETINGSLTQVVSAGVAITTPSTYALTAPPQITLVTPAAGIMNGAGGVTLVAPGGQMTVDYSFFKIGERHAINYAIKVTCGTLRIGLTAYWLRRLGVHACAYGLKVDIKAVDDKNVKEKKVVITELVVRGVKAVKEAFQQRG
jgi:type VI secretion system secreted protein VgrG